jgi:class 3 adenylate cyclase
MRCSKCGDENPDDNKFCGDCGAPLTNRCPKCGSDSPPGKRFCGACGAPLWVKNAIAQSPTSVSILPDITRSAEQTASIITEGERRIVTALFADIKSSTELMRELDPEEARAVIDPVLQLMMDAVHRYGGYVVQSAGDGIFALFGAPVAHEDHPQRAVQAAIAMRDAFRHRASDPTSRAAVNVRIGINTGEVVLRLVHTGGHTEYTPVGHAANLAARMQSAAQAGTIVVSEDTRRLVAGYFEVRELGPTPVKGIGGAINLTEVVGARPLHGHFELARQRGLTKFVGRDDELKQMTRALELALDRHGQIVAVVAEAGTGKSRLFYEFKARIPTECKLLEAYSVSHGKASAWLPVLELLRGYFGIGDSDDAASRRAKVRGALAALDPLLEGALPYLLGLLGIIEGADPLAQMDPRIQRQRTLDEISRILLRETIKHPLVVIFEDLHWVDDHSQALLDSLADRIGSARLLLLVNYRPEYHHNWGNKSCYSQLRLDALGSESAQEMLDALLPMPIPSSENLPLARSAEGEGPVSGESADLTALKRLVIERTGGNPFFIEEIVQALFEDGGLVRNGTVKVTRSLSALRLPPTVQGILASRIDRLSAAHKNLLQTMAVIGREAPLGVLRRVVRVETELEDDLRVLRAGEFVYEQPTTNDVEYVFKHALTQEVAYKSLLMEERRRLHERTGAAIESLYGMRLDDYVSELARHYRHSGNTGKALEYLQRAAAQAMARSSYEEAITLFSSALELLKILPDRSERIQQELALQLDLGSAPSPVKGWAAPEVGRYSTVPASYAASLAIRRIVGRTQWTLRFLRHTRGGAQSPRVGAANSGYCGKRPR